MMELIKNNYDEDIYFCFTVQEETGLRGASVLSRRINPDVAFILEATTASDTAFSKEQLYSTTLGKGPVITMMDRPRLILSIMIAPALIVEWKVLIL